MSLEAAACINQIDLMHDRAREREAKALCSGCPAVQECRALFESMPVDWRRNASGVWFGTTVETRGRRRPPATRERPALTEERRADMAVVRFAGPRCSVCDSLVHRAGAVCRSCRDSARATAARDARPPIVSPFEDTRQQITTLLRNAEGRL